jgi:hypothetical protein
LITGGTSDCFVQAYLDANNTDNQVFIALDKFQGNVSPEQSNVGFAFTTWNDANGNQWTLRSGGSLDITLAVVEMATISDVTVGGNTFKNARGGVSMGIFAFGYNPGANDPAPGQLVWTQAVMANFQPGNSGPGTFITLDTFDTKNRQGNCTALPAPPNAKNNTTPTTIPPNVPPDTAPGYCGPIYLFQVAPPLPGGVNVMLDDAGATIPGASFRAIAMLSTVTVQTDAQGNVTNRILTLYDGVSYGFDTYAPEPGSWVMAALGFLAAAVLKARTTSRLESYRYVAITLRRGHCALYEWRVIRPEPVAE